MQGVCLSPSPPYIIITGPAFRRFLLPFTCWTIAGVCPLAGAKGLIAFPTSHMLNRCLVPWDCENSYCESLSHVLASELWPCVAPAQTVVENSGQFPCVIADEIWESFHSAFIYQVHQFKGYGVRLSRYGCFNGWQLIQKSREQPI